VVCRVPGPIGRRSIRQLAIRAAGIPSIPFIFEAFSGNVFGGTVHSTEGTEDEEKDDPDGDGEDENCSDLAELASLHHLHQPFIIIE